jgi:CRISPR-associated RAMP protein (TIGR02581 family)
MTISPDLSTFTTRLHFQGCLVFESALRIGAQKSQAVDEPDLPVLRNAAGLPYIPGSSFKGALRSYVEAVARALQARPGMQEHNLACLPVGKASERPAQDPIPDICLFQSEVSLLKQVKPQEWHTSGKMPSELVNRLPSAAVIQNDVTAHGEGQVVDRTLRDLSCWTCRIFGAPWLASKVLIRDLVLVPETFFRTEIRDGVGIDRDTGRAASGLKYQFEIVPAGAAFGLELLVENATEAELGLLWLGVSAFERGEVLMGGARSRGLGWCKLTPEWTASRYVTAENLLDILLRPAEMGVLPDLSQAPPGWLSAFAVAIGAQGGSHAQATVE